MAKLPVEEIISRAMQEGVFDDLPGKGKPLNLEHFPHQDPDWRVAHHLLKSSGFSLPWIERLGEINEKLQAARHYLEIAWTRQQGTISSPEIKDSNQIEWLSAIDQFKIRLKVINDQIHIYNLEVPNLQFQIPFIEIDQELARVMNDPDS
ncbi:MAG: DnaJ family domain-containing protein [Anaerolineales bacterium]